MAFRLNNYKTILAFSLTVLLIPGCATIRPDIDYDPKQDFNKLNSYAWLPIADSSDNNPGKIRNDLLHDRIQGAIERELAAKGYEKTASVESADFGINYLINIETKIDVSTIHTGWAYSPGGYFYGSGISHSDTVVREYKAGTLIIDIVNSEDKLVWRGSAQSRIKNNISPQERSEKINQVVKGILQEFPPL
jgi:hypothetical protein